MKRDRLNEYIRSVFKDVTGMRGRVLNNTRHASAGQSRKVCCATYADTLRATEDQFHDVASVLSSALNVRQVIVRRMHGQTNHSQLALTILLK